MLLEIIFLFLLVQFVSTQGTGAPTGVTPPPDRTVDPRIYMVSGKFFKSAPSFISDFAKVNTTCFTQMKPVLAYFSDFEQAVLVNAAAANSDPERCFDCQVYINQIAPGLDAAMNEMTRTLSEVEIEKRNNLTCLVNFANSFALDQMTTNNITSQIMTYFYAQRVRNECVARFVTRLTDMMILRRRFVCAKNTDVNVMAIKDANSNTIGFKWSLQEAKNFTDAFLEMSACNSAEVFTYPQVVVDGFASISLDQKCMMNAAVVPLNVTTTTVTNISVVNTTVSNGPNSPPPGRLLFESLRFLQPIVPGVPSATAASEPAPTSIVTKTTTPSVVETTSSVPGISTIVSPPSTTETIAPTTTTVTTQPTTTTKPTLTTQPTTTQPTTTVTTQPTTTTKPTLTTQPTTTQPTTTTTLTQPATTPATTPPTTTTTITQPTTQPTTTSITTQPTTTTTTPQPVVSVTTTPTNITESVPTTANITTVSSEGNTTIMPNATTTAIIEINPVRNPISENVMPVLLTRFSFANDTNQKTLISNILNFAGEDRNIFDAISNFVKDAQKETSNPLFDQTAIHTYKNLLSTNQYRCIPDLWSLFLSNVRSNLDILPEFKPNAICTANSITVINNGTIQCDKCSFNNKSIVFVSNIYNPMHYYLSSICLNSKRSVYAHIIDRAGISYSTFQQGNIDLAERCISKAISCSSNDPPSTDCPKTKMNQPCLTGLINDCTNTGLLPRIAKMKRLTTDSLYPAPCDYNKLGFERNSTLFYNSCFNWIAQNVLINTLQFNTTALKELDYISHRGRLLQAIGSLLVENDPTLNDPVATGVRNIQRNNTLVVIDGTIPNIGVTKENVLDTFNSVIFVSPRNETTKEPLDWIVPMFNNKGEYLSASFLCIFSLIMFML